MLKYLYLAILIAAASANPVLAQSTLTLDEAVDLAVENNYAIRISRNEARIAENDYSIGNAGFLPSLDVSAQQSRRAFGNVSGDQAVFGTAHTVDLAMNLSTTLFDGGGQFAAYRRLGSEMEQIALDADRTTEATLAEVVISYYDLVRLQEQVEVQAEAVAISEERLRIAELRRDLGSASELEVRRARVDLNADRAALLRQEVSFANAKADFNQLIAREGSLDFSVADTIRVDRSLQIEDLRDVAPRRNKTLAVVRQVVHTAELSRAEVRTEWLPSISLSAGYGFNNFTEEIGLPAGRPPGLNYGLTASWGIFDGFNRKRRLENATLRLQNTELAMQDARTALSTRLENAYDNYQNSLELVDLERENVSLAEFNVDIALEQFRVGTITSVDLREVQSAFTNAELRFITAQFEAARAQTDLLQLSGILLDRIDAGR